MKNKKNGSFCLIIMFVFYTSCVQNQSKGKKIIINSENKGVITYGPHWITRNIIQDRKGNIWIAAFDGIFRYDGKYFINITSKVSSARFFSVLEDKRGNLWFGSIGSGVYYYDGKSFQNFTTKDGLAGIALLVFMKIKPAIFGSEQVVTMVNYFEILRRKTGFPITMLMLLLKIKQASFGLLQQAIPSCMMEKNLTFSLMRVNLFPMFVR